MMKLGREYAPDDGRSSEGQTSVLRSGDERCRSKVRCADKGILTISVSGRRQQRWSEYCAEL